MSACDSLRLCCEGSWIFPISWYLARCGLMQVGEVCIVDASVVFFSCCTCMVLDTIAAGVVSGSTCSVSGFA